MFRSKSRKIFGHKSEKVEEGLSEEQVAKFIDHLIMKLKSAEAALVESDVFVSPAKLAQNVLREINGLTADQQDVLASLQAEANRIETEAKERAQRIREEAEEDIKTALSKMLQEVPDAAQDKVAAIEAAAKEKIAVIENQSRDKLQSIEVAARREVRGMVATSKSNIDKGLKAAVKKSYDSLLAQLETLTSGLRDMASQTSQGSELPSAPPSMMAHEAMPAGEESPSVSADMASGAQTAERDESHTATGGEDTAVEGSQACGAMAEEIDVPKVAGEELLRRGLAEVNIAAPLDIAQLAMLRRGLEQIPGVSILSMRGLVDGGASIIIDIQDMIPLLELLGNIPVVEEAVEEASPPVALGQLGNLLPTSSQAQDSLGKKVTISLKGSKR